MWIHINALISLSCTAKIEAIRMHALAMQVNVTACTAKIKWLVSYDPTSLLTSSCSPSIRELMVSYVQCSKITLLMQEAKLDQLVPVH